jgi:quinol monooxygenase YgiN
MVSSPGADATPFVLQYRYKSKDAAQKHTGEPHFKELFGAFEKEGILAKPAYIAMSKSVEGFDSNRSLL